MGARAYILLTPRSALRATLKAGHARGVLHGDIAHRNVLRSPGGRLRLVDFGNSIVGADPSDLAEENRALIVPFDIASHVPATGS